MGIAHFALDLGLGDHGRHRVDDHDIHRAGTNQRFADFQGLLAGIGLGDQQLVNIHAQIFGVNGVQGMLHIDENGGAAALLGFGHHMQGHGGLTAGFRPVDLDDSAAGQAADAQCHIQRKGAGGDGFHIHGGILAQAHDSPFAKLLFDLADGGFQGFLLIAGGGGGFLCFFLDGHAISSQSDGILIPLYTIFAGIARGKRKFVRGWGKKFWAANFRPSGGIFLPRAGRRAPIAYPYIRVHARVGDFYLMT